MKHLLCCMAAILSLSLAANAKDEKPFIGFAGMEMYKLDWATQNLKIADVNGDKLDDIVVANNARARIECLLQRKPSDRADAKPVEGDVNEIPNSACFESKPYLTDKRVFSLEVGDLNGDGRQDMVYYGDPRELVVVLQDSNGQWGAKRSFDITDGSPEWNSIAIGDVNGDGRNDLVLLATDGTYFLYQNTSGQLDAPIKEAGLPEGAIAVVIRDFNGDGRQDLLYFCSSEMTPLCFRFQNNSGKLGAEVRCKAPGINSLAVGNLDGAGANDIIAIHRPQPRLVAYRISSEAPDVGILDGAIVRYALRAGARRARALAFGKLAGSGMKDIVVADPDVAEIELFRQSQPGQWDRQKPFPSLQGITDVAILDVEGKPAILALSPDEPMLGIARFDDKGSLPFPQPLPIVGKPLCITVADLFGDGKREILYVSAQDRDRSIRVLGTDTDAAFSEKLRIPIEDARTDPEGLIVADANQDGRMDVLLFTPFQEMRIFKAGQDKKFTDVSRGADYGKGLVQTVAMKSVGILDVTGDGKPEILIASKSFARALRLNDRDRLEVIQQFNGRSPTSQITAVAGYPLGNGVSGILLADAANRCLTLLKPTGAGAYEIAENLQIGQLSLERMEVADLGGTGRPAILLATKNEFFVVQPGASRIVLKELASYETSVKNGRLDQVEVADFARDGRKQLVVTEGTKHLLDLLSWRRDPPGFEKITSWPIFESRLLPGVRGAAAQAASFEPREYAIGCVTNPDKPDLVLLIHDRLLIYRQQ